MNNNEVSDELRCMDRKITHFQGIQKRGRSEGRFHIGFGVIIVLVLLHPTHVRHPWDDKRYALQRQYIYIYIYIPSPPFIQLFFRHRQ